MSAGAKRRMRIAGWVLVFALTQACAHKRPDAPVVPRLQQSILPVNYAGAWERNYSRGGDIQENVTRLARRLNGYSQGSAGPNSRRTPGYTSSSPSLGPIISMARLADSITQSDTLLIEHDIDQIVVEREEEFALTCEFSDSTVQQYESMLGSEICGWDGEKMVFHVSLPDGLTVTHRLTLSGDGSELNVATTVTSPVSSVPYTLNRFYRRYEPLDNLYHCEQTLSRKKVCWMREPDQ